MRPGIAFIIWATLAMAILLLAAWYGGRASVHCPGMEAEMERADGDLRRMMVIADSAQAETARWQARYDSLHATQRPVTQQIHETRHYLRSRGLDALGDSIGAKPDE